MYLTRQRPVCHFRGLTLFSELGLLRRTPVVNAQAEAKRADPNIRFALVPISKAGIIHVLSTSFICKLQPTSRVSTAIKSAAESWEFMREKLILSHQLYPLLCAAIH